VTPEHVSSLYKKALKKINKEVSIPGFRRGRAPDAMVTKNFGAHIEKEWKEMVLEDAYKEMMAATEIYPFSQETIKPPKMNSCTKEEGAKIEFSYERHPDVPEVDVNALTVEKVSPKEIADSDVEQAMKELKDVFADYEEVQERSAQMGDFATVDIAVIKDDEEQPLCTDQRLEVAEGKMGKWLIDLCLGKNVNDVFEGESEYDPTTTPNEEEFKPSKCKITLKKLEARVEMSDEDLAKKTGLQTAEELFEQVRKDLEQRAKNSVEKVVQEQIRAQIVEKYAFELPSSLFQSERETAVKNRIRGMKRANVADETVESEQEKIEEEVSQEVTERLRFYFITRRIAEKENITVTQDEMIQEFQRQQWSVPVEERVISEEMEPEELRARLYVAIITQKVNQFLSEKAVTA
jgi:trigger factor